MWGGGERFARVAPTSCLRVALHASRPPPAVRWVQVKGYHGHQALPRCVQLPNLTKVHAQPLFALGTSTWVWGSGCCCALCEKRTCSGHLVL